MDFMRDFFFESGSIKRPSILGYFSERKVADFTDAVFTIEI